ncbi:hypothetical protein AJ87_41820 [Rhizobium yanglingense]|nr:hypothetical protein AJ87_41820 [Rhizobium yanglingense]
MAVAGEIMLATVNRHRLFDHGGEPQRICATFAFVPHAAGNDRPAGLAVGEMLVADRIEHDAVRVAKRDHEIRASNLRVQELHLRERQQTHSGIGFAATLYVGKGDHAVPRGTPRVECEITASLPAVCNDRLQGADREALALFQRITRTVYSGKMLHVSSSCITSVKVPALGKRAQ